MRDYRWYERPLYMEPFVIVPIIVLVVLFSLAFYFGAKRQDWLDANCTVIGKMSGSSGTGIGPVVGGNGGIGVTSVYVSGKTGYQCNDGLIYWE